jgi:hypothetical protein
MPKKNETKEVQAPGPCVAYLRNGRICGLPATDYDPHLEGVACRKHLPRKSRPRLTVAIDGHVISELRSAVGWLQVNATGAEARVTVNSLVERAIASELRRHRKRHRGGKAFEADGPSPRTGRPVGA